MKKTFTLIILVFVMTQFVKAETEFFLKINPKGNYTVYLNDEILQTKKNNIVRFFDIYPGNYYLKVVRQNGWVQQIVYQGNIQLQNGFRYAAELQSQYGLKIIAQIPVVQQEWFIDQLITNYNQYSPNQYPNLPMSNWNNNYNYGNNYGMDNNSFNQLKNIVSKAKFDNDRIQIIKSALMNNYLQSAQVKELLLLIIFESNRLDLAKYCYDRTIDRQNYYSVYDTFTFSDSIKQLGDYIAKR